MGKRIIISENEKNRILNLYGILKNVVNEQQKTSTTQTTTTQTTSKKSLEPITIQVNFESGCHSNKGGQKCVPNVITSVFNPYMEQIKSFLKSAPSNQVVEVVLSASESKVPNRDAEKPKTEKQTDGSYKHPKVDPKIISQYRYTSIEEYLKGEFQKMLSNKEISKMPEFVKNEVIIGGPDWNTNLGSKHESYKEHQYLNAVIKLKEGVVQEVFKPDPLKMTSPNAQCIEGIKIEYSYDEVVEQVAPHCCNRGRFYMYANGVQLKRVDGADFASINNDPVYGEQDKQKEESRPQLQTLGKVYSKDGKKELCYTEKTKNQVDFKTNRHKLNSIPESKPGNYRYNTFIITKEQAAAIVKKAQRELGYLSIQAYAAKQINNQQPHEEAVRCTIYRADGTLAYDSCPGGNCEKTAYGPWNINYCPKKTTTTTPTTT